MDFFSIIQKKISYEEAMYCKSSKKCNKMEYKFNREKTTASDTQIFAFVSIGLSVCIKKFAITAPVFIKF